MSALLHAECAEATHPCFTDKMRLWRSREAGLGVHVPEGWRGPSLKERANRAVAEARAAGADPVPVGNRWV